MFILCLVVLENSEHFTHTSMLFMDSAMGMHGQLLKNTGFQVVDTLTKQFFVVYVSSCERRDVTTHTN